MKPANKSSRASDQPAERVQLYGENQGGRRDENKPQLEIGSRVGSCEIRALIGKGGMGEVYRAWDTAMERDVAIKTLPAEFSSDPGGLERLQREARVLGKLNHPQIAQVYSVEETAAGRCIVLEWVDGETIEGRLKRGPIPIMDALEIGRQIAEALEAAHDCGIVHRDLKPANVQISSKRKIKVLDFGLAEVLQQRPRSDSETTVTVGLPPSGTPEATGGIEGTPRYMPPEQANGESADARSDIWSFGVLLYEMLTGRTPFGGETLIKTLSAVLRSEPDWTALPAATPPAIRSLLRRMLQKDRGRRLRDVADARFQIEEALSEPATSVAPARKNHVRMWAVAAMLAALAALSLTTILYFRSAAPVAPEARFLIDAPVGNLTSFAISPDGTKIVFQAKTEGENQLWIRSIDSDVPQLLRGTAGANLAFPFWNPNSRSIGFFANGQLKRIDLESGLVHPLANATGVGGTWNSRGIILFAPTFTGPLYQVSEDGGNAEEVTHIDPAQLTGHIYPSFLPDGRHFLFLGYGKPESRGIYIGSLGSDKTERLFETDFSAVFAPPDRVLFQRKGTLLAQRLDLDTLKPVGDASPIAQRVAVDSDSVRIAVSAAAGSVTYRASYPERVLVWMDRSGQQSESVEGPDTANPRDIRLSPDGNTVAFIREVNQQPNVWLLQTVGGALHQFTYAEDWVCCPVWSTRDGARIAYGAAPKGPVDIYEKGVGGAGPPILLMASSEDKTVKDSSPDGQYILYEMNASKTAWDLWVMLREGDRQTSLIAQMAGSAEELNGRFSPNGHWIAYQSNSTGQNEIYVKAFPGPGTSGEWPITGTSGGSFPRWSPDGQELFYLGLDNHLMAVRITFNGPAVQAAKPVYLFTLPPDSEYAVARDGKRFLVNKIVHDAAPITILLNWKPPSK